MNRNANVKFGGFEPAIRRNWGYHDGVAARQRGKFPVWCKGYQDMAKVHYDKAYGEGFKIGWYNETPPKGAII